MKRQRLFFISF